MKSIVGFVATLVLFTGCGVGVDDPEGMAAAGLTFVQGQSALTVQNVGATGQTVTSPLTGAPGGTVGVPQDPIPYMDPKLGTPAEEGPLPMDRHGPRPLR